MGNEASLPAQALQGGLSALEAQLRAGANPNKRLQYTTDVGPLPKGCKCTPLGYALLADNTSMLRALLAAKANPNKHVGLPHQYDLTPLHLAAALGRAEAISILLAAGADPGTPVTSKSGTTRPPDSARPLPLPASLSLTRLGDTALHIAVDCAGDGRAGSGAVEALLAHPSTNVTARNARGRTPLYKACERNDPEVATLLASHPRCDANAGKPLFAALGSVQLVSVLLASGADASARNVDGQTPLEVAVTRQRLLSTTDNRAAIVRQLIAAGAEADAAMLDFANRNGWTAVAEALRSAPEDPGRRHPTPPAAAAPGRDISPATAGGGFGPSGPASAQHAAARGPEAREPSGALRPRRRPQGDAAQGRPDGGALGGGAGPGSAAGAGDGGAHGAEPSSGAAGVGSAQGPHSGANLAGSSWESQRRPTHGMSPPNLPLLRAAFGVRRVFGAFGGAFGEAGRSARVEFRALVRAFLTALVAAAVLLILGLCILVRLVIWLGVRLIRMRQQSIQETPLEAARPLSGDTSPLMSSVDAHSGAGQNQVSVAKASGSMAVADARALPVVQGMAGAAEVLATNLTHAARAASVGTSTHAAASAALATASAAFKALTSLLRSFIPGAVVAFVAHVLGHLVSMAALQLLRLGLQSSSACDRPLARALGRRPVRLEAPPGEPFFPALALRLATGMPIVPLVGIMAAGFLAWELAGVWRDARGERLRPAGGRRAEAGAGAQPVPGAAAAAGEGPGRRPPAGPGAMPDPAEAEGGGAGAGGVCCVCLSEAAVFGFVHADVVHCCLCGGCMAELRRQRGLASCPVCKRAATAVTKVVGA